LAAKTQLYRQNWATALSLCEEVINSGQYSLYSDYKTMFEESGELCSESILEVQNYVNDNGSLAYFGDFPERTGIRGAGIFNQGWGWNTPSQALVSAYEDGDARKEGTILFKDSTDGYGNTLAHDLQLPYWNRKTYGDPARAKKTNYRKAVWMNVRILRYADVLLMAAEAANELGGTDNVTKALGYLERVRARARGRNKDILTPVTTTDKALLRAAIKHERRVEFGMEFERFYDLVRWGDALTVLGPLGYTNRCRYYPIPQKVLTQSNGIITQNPEWK
jgi:starch-binding outer membrane protein, SusD/RagB family